MEWEKMADFKLGRMTLVSGKNVIAYVGQIEGVADGILFIEDEPGKQLAEVVAQPKLAGNFDALIDDMRPVDIIDVVACRDNLYRELEKSKNPEAKKTET